MQKKCDHCNRIFRSQRSNRKYCSDSCRQMAYYKRNGITQTHDSEVDSIYDNHSPAAATVKYNRHPIVKDNRTVKTVNDGGTIIDESLLAALADRMFELIEERIDEKLKTVKYNSNNTVKSVNVKRTSRAKGIVKDADSIDHSFTAKTNRKGITGLYNRSRSIKDDNDTVKPDTVKYADTLRQPSTSVKDVNDDHMIQQLSALNLMNEDDDLNDAALSGFGEDDQEEEGQEDHTLRKTSRYGNLRQDFTVTSDEEDTCYEENDDQIAPQQSPSLVTGGNLIVKDAIDDIVKRDEDNTWVKPQMTQRILHFYRNGNLNIDDYIRTLEYTDRENCNEAMAYTRCLIGTVVRLSNRPRVEWDTFVTVVNTLTKFVHSKLFTSLSERFEAYTSTISDLQFKLRNAGMACEENAPIRIRISKSQKTWLAAVYSDLACLDDDVSFEEISLPD